MTDMIILGNPTAMKLLKADNDYGDAARLLLAFDLSMLPDEARRALCGAAEDDGMVDEETDLLSKLEMIADVHGERAAAEEDRRLEARRKGKEAVAQGLSPGKGEQYWYGDEIRGRTTLRSWSRPNGDEVKPDGNKPTQEELDQQGRDERAAYGRNV